MTRKFAATIFFLLCALEGLLALAVMAGFVPSGGAQPARDPSLLKLVLLGLNALIVALLVVLGVQEWRTPPGQDSLMDRLLARRYLVLGLFGLFVIGLAGGYILLLSPIRPSQLQGLYRRFQPWILWGILIPVQFFGLALLRNGPRYWAQAWRDLTFDRRARRLAGWLNSPAAGVALLLLAFAAGLTKLYFGRFVDEADNMTVGWLVSQGYRLYGDVFSHHFPLPYYWVALVVRLSGNSFAAVRLSLLVLQVVLFALCMRWTRLYLPIGLTVLAWNLINQFHRGQEAIYATFEAIFMAAAFILVFWLLVKRFAAGPAPLGFTGLLLGLALLSDPLMIYPAAVAFLGLFASGILSQPPPRWREGLRRIGWAGAATALVLGVFAVQLFASGTAQDFYRSTVWFNAEIYAKYEPAGPERTGKVIANAAGGLGILDPKYVQHTSPFIPLGTYRSVRLDDERLYFSWIFASFLFRLSILACTLGLILNRRTAAGAFLYLFAAAILIRDPDGLYAMGFTLVSLFAAFYLILELRRPARLAAVRGAARPGLKLAWTALIVVIGAMQLWSAFRGRVFLGRQLGLDLQPQPRQDVR